MLVAAFSLAPVHQKYLLQARQMQTLSFAMHIPLVCFAISFPAMVPFVEWRYLQTRDELYLALARRWSRVPFAFIVLGFAAMRPTEVAALDPDM